MRIRFQLFTVMWTWIQLFTFWSKLSESAPVAQRPSRAIFSLQASIVNVHGPPLLYVEPLKFQSFDLNADLKPDLASKNNKDPDPQPCGKRCRLTTLVWSPVQCTVCMEELSIKTQNPICRLFISWPVNRICGILLNRFYRLEIHSLMVCIFDPAFELLPPWTKELYGTCVLLPLYCTVPSLWPPPPPLPNVQFIQTVCDLCGGGGLVKCILDHICRSFTLSLWPDSKPTKLKNKIK